MRKDKRILCVDDEADSCDLMKIYLEQAGYDVVTAMTMAEGLQLARNQKFDLYILDVLLPDGSGLEFVRQLRNFDRKTPFVFHSANAYEKDIRCGLAKGAIAYITKPSDPDFVVELVDKLVFEAAVTVETRPQAFFHAQL